MVLGINRPDIGLLLEGEPRPPSLSGTVSPTSSVDRTAIWDRANQDLFVALFLLTSGSAQLMVRKHKAAITSTRGDGISAWNDLTAKYLSKSKEARRALLQRLHDTKMSHGQDPDDYFLAAELIRAELYDMGEPVSDATYEDILVRGFTSEYDTLKMSIYRDPTYTLDQIQLTMRNFYLDELSRAGSVTSVAGRGAAMVMSIICHNCQQPGHYKSTCPELRNQGPRNDKRSGQTWCSYHRSKTHNTDMCRARQTDKPPVPATASGPTSGTHVAASTSAPSSADVPVDYDSTPFDGGFLFSASSSTPTASSNTDTITLLIDSGATEHYLDSYLVPGLLDMSDFRALLVPKSIVAAGGHVLRGTHSGVLPVSVADDKGKFHRIKLTCILVPGLGRHIFSTMEASRRGVTTTIEAGCHRLVKGDITLPLQQLDQDMGLCSITVHIVNTSALTHHGTVMVAHHTADVWHRRLGHMNPRNMKLLQGIDNNGVDYTNDVTGCSVCAVGKSKQRAHPKRAIYDITAPMQLVYTDLMGPISPPAIGGFQYVSKFTDHYSRWHELFLIKTKSDAVATLKLYNSTLSVSVGRRVERLRSDKGGEYTGKAFTQACNDAAIKQEFTSTNTPQQNGVSERDGGTLAAIARCFMIDGKFPKSLWGELLFTAAYIANRSPHSTLGGDTPYFRLYGKHADLSALRVIGSRSFVHTEVYTSKFEDKAWEGILCGYSTTSKSYRVYNPSTRHVVESRNVTFLETPPRNIPTSSNDPEAAYDHYFFDVLNFTSTFNDRSFDIDHVEATARMRNMIDYDSAPALASSTSSGFAPSTPSSTLPTFSGVAPVVPALTPFSTPPITRASTRNRPTVEPPINTNDLNPAQLRSLRGLGNFMASTVDFGHASEYPASLAFACIAGSPTTSGTAGEGDHRIKIPDTYGEAKSSPQAQFWEAAINKEMNSLKEHDVFDLVPITNIPKGEKAIGSRYVFKQKADNTFKARLVVQGFSQRPGIDYGQSFAPVCRIGSQRVVLGIACEHDWLIYQLDVQVAFLQSKIDGEVYVKTAPGRDAYDNDGTRMVMKLKKSLYGLSQSLALWYGTIDISRNQIRVYIPTVISTITTSPS